jgi:uncharacterized protein (UPF0212 family)
MKKLIQLFALVSIALAGVSFAEEAAKPVNTKCPISGEDIDAKQTVAYTKVVGVCCEKCEAKVTKDVAGNLAKIAKVEAKIVNSKCPISGEDIDAAHVVSYKGAKVGVCCGKCEKNFNAEKHGAKIVMDVAGNDKCPFSGEAVEKKAVVSFTVAVCCAKCQKKVAAEPDKYIGKVEFAKVAKAAE